MTFTREIAEIRFGTGLSPRLRGPRDVDDMMRRLTGDDDMAKRYKIDRELMDEYGAQSQQRACAAAEAGKFEDEIVPIKVTMGVADPKTKLLGTREVTLSEDEGRRPGTTAEAISKIRPALPGGVISAGNASQFSDGAGA